MLQYKHFFFMNARKSAEYLNEFLRKIILKTALNLSWQIKTKIYYWRIVNS